MDDKNKEIIKQKDLQLELRKRIKSIKNKRPTFIIGLTLFAIFVIFYLESKVYVYFGGAVKFITFSIIIYLIIISFYLFKSYAAITKKGKEIKTINKKLYKLMKLDTENINE